MESLVSALQQLPPDHAYGCVHVGLRPSTAANHLFDHRQVRELISLVRAVPRTREEDFATIQAWIDGENATNRFNLGCLFALGTHNELRVCLHPKIVPSPQECTALEETYLTSGDVLSLVTLLPENKSILSVTVQPLLCSDGLFLPSDGPTKRPFEAVNNPGEVFGGTVPDHVDIVSLATCMPNRDFAGGRGIKGRQWHQLFRDTFTRLASDDLYTRHHNSLFVIANFLDVDGTGAGGLSGTFLPVPPIKIESTFLQFSVYARGENLDYSWSIPDHTIAKDQEGLGYLACLDPYVANDGAVATIFGFTISRIPRERAWLSSSQIERIIRRTLEHQPGGDSELVIKGAQQ